MSPELFIPEEANLNDCRPTKNSDCYALGMVIYEVLSGNKPFFGCSRNVVVAKVINGERPERPRAPEGRLFTDVIWNTLERCWKRNPGDRPRVEDVLHCLETQLPQEGPEQDGILEDDVHVVRVGPPAQSFFLIKTKLGLVAQVPQPPPISDQRSLQRLLSGAVPRDELAPLIESIVSNVKADTIVEFLQGSNAQAFVEAMDKVLLTFSVSE